MTYAVTLNFVLLFLLGLLVVGLLRSYAEVVRRLHELEQIGPVASATANGNGNGASAEEGAELGAGIGSIALPIHGHRPGGSATSLDFSRGNRTDATLLIFMSAGCVSCGSIWESLQGAARELAEFGIGRNVVLTKSPGDEDPVRVQRLAGDFTNVVMSTEAFRLYGAEYTPYFVLVRPSGEIAGVGTAQSWGQMLEMIREATLDEEFAARLAPRRGLVSLLRRRARGPRTVESTRQQAVRADRELAAAGIGAGHESLYPGETHES